MEHAVEIRGTCTRDRTTYYNVGVRDSSREWIVERRYTDFVDLHAILKSQGLSLPDMPPKSTFRKAFSSKFNEDRERKLQAVLQAALACDKDVKMQDLRKFLDIKTLSVLDKKLALEKKFKSVAKSEPVLANTGVGRLCANPAAVQNIKDIERRASLEAATRAECGRVDQRKDSKRWLAQESDAKANADRNVLEKKMDTAHKAAAGVAAKADAASNSSKRTDIPVHQSIQEAVMPEAPSRKMEKIVEASSDNVNQTAGKVCAPQTVQVVPDVVKEVERAGVVVAANSKERQAVAESEQLCYEASAKAEARREKRPLAQRTTMDDVIFARKAELKSKLENARVVFVNPGEAETIFLAHISACATVAEATDLLQACRSGKCDKLAFPERSPQLAASATLQREECSSFERARSERAAADAEMTRCESVATTKSEPPSVEPIPAEADGEQIGLAIKKTIGCDAVKSITAEAEVNTKAVTKRDEPECMVAPRTPGMEEKVKGATYGTATSGDHESASVAISGVARARIAQADSRVVKRYGANMIPAQPEASHAAFETLDGAMRQFRIDVAMCATVAEATSLLKAYRGRKCAPAAFSDNACAKC